LATVKKRKKKRNKKSGNRSSSAKYRQLVLTRATETILGHKVTSVEYPGGKSRESYRMLFDDADSIIATRRDDLDRARIEVQTLRALNKHNARVPLLLGTNHSHILLQQEIRGSRLSQMLKTADETQCKQLLSSALSALAHVQKSATEENLESVVDALGDEEDWLVGLVERPEIIGDYLEEPAPELDFASLVRRLSIVEARFIKWDARPGNALVNEDSEVFWFDWEHAGKRNRMDDVAWILGDEFVPDYPDVEKSLIQTFVPEFAGPMAVDDAREYLMAYGTFHLVVRLGLILKYMDGEWWDLDYCIDGDKVGVTLVCAQRLCKRGARWAAQCELTSKLAPWFQRIESRLEDL